MSPCTICSPLVSATAKTYGKTLEPFPQKEPHISAKRALHCRKKSPTFPIRHQARVKRNYSNNFQKNRPTFLQKEPCISAKRAPYCPIPTKLEPYAIARIISRKQSPYISGKRALYFRQKSPVSPPKEPHVARSPINKSHAQLCFISHCRKDVARYLHNFREKLLTFPQNKPYTCAYREVGGWGRDPKKCTGRDWGMGSSTI